MLGKLVEGAVLVIEAKSATREAAGQAKQILEAANVRILGAVLNEWTATAPVKNNAVRAPAQPSKPVTREAPRKPKESSKVSSPPPRKETPSPDAAEIASGYCRR